MSEFVKDNHVKNLPDVFCKSKESNNFKLLELERLTLVEYRKTLQELFNMIKLENARLVWRNSWTGKRKSHR